MGVYTGFFFFFNYNLEQELRSSVTEERIQEIKNESLTLIEITEERISDELTNDFNILKTLALTLAKPLYEGDLDSVIWVYTSLCNNDPSISGVWVVNSSDIIVAGKDHPYFPIGKNISNDIVHQSFLDLIEEGYNESTFPLITFNPWFVGGSDNDQYGMGYDYPIFYNNSYIGKVMMTRIWTQFQTIIQGLKIGDSGKTILINLNGDLIAGNYDNYSQPYSFNFFQQYPEYNSSQNILNQTVGISSLNIYADIEFVFSFKMISMIKNPFPEFVSPMIAQRWTVITLFSIEEFFSPVERNTAILNEVFVQMFYYILVSFLILIIFILTSAYFSSKSIETPIIQLINATKKIKQGDLDCTIELARNDEIGELTESFSEMVLNLKTIQEKLLIAQKMEAIGRLAGGVAHDFNNLLTVINGLSLLMIDNIPDDKQEIKSNLQEILDAGNRAADLTKQLLSFSRKQIIQPKVLNLNILIQNMSKMLQRLIGEDIILNVIYFDKLANIFVDPNQIEQVILNLSINARDAMPQGGNLTIEVSNLNVSEENFDLNLKPGNYVKLSISDTGCGITEDQAPHLFEPFYTTKPLGRGTGLGLSTVYGILKQNEGEISFYTQVGTGTTFNIYFPQTFQSKKEIIISKTNTTEKSTGNETILVVEDDESIRTFILKILSSKGYRVLDAENPIKALEISRSYEEYIDLVISDIIMPSMSGIKFEAILVEERPGIPFLFISGYPKYANINHSKLKKNHVFLPKPFTASDLCMAIRKIFGD